eukprot:2806254-Pleurochrysis_carterae.AAC.1
MQMISCFLVLQCRLTLLPMIKNRWVVGYFAWMVEKGCVKEVTVSFIMVGHTHEDIDALFKRVVTVWRGLKRVLSPL